MSSSGTQISDMTVTASPLPAGTFFPLVVTDVATGLSPALNYRYDLGTDLLTRVSYAALAASSGASFVGYLPAGTGAVPTDAETKLRESVSATDFGTFGAGSDAAILQKGYDYIASVGGDFLIPPVPLHLTSQCTLTLGSLDVNIFAYGSVITTTGAISGLKVVGSSETVVHISGLTVDHNGNATATAGIEMAGTNHSQLEDCRVIPAGASINPTYCPILYEQTNAADPNTGVFWPYIENTIVRASGNDLPTRGLMMRGAINAADFSTLSIEGAWVGIDIETSATDSSAAIANAARLGAYFEQVGICVRINGRATFQSAEGVQIHSARVEAGQFGSPSHPFIAITALTSVTTTATATVASTAMLASGQKLTISGASPSAYNGTYVITVTNSTHFTYTFASGTSPATGTVTAVPVTAILALEGTAVSAYRKPQIYDPVCVGTVEYLIDPNALGADIWDHSQTAPSTSVSYFSKGWQIKSLDSSQDVAEIWAANTGSGLGFHDNNGQIQASIRWAASGIIEFAAASSYSLALTKVSGLSSTATRGTNLASSAAFSSGTSAVATLANTEPDTNYDVIPIPTTDPGGRVFYVADSDKTTTQYTMRCSGSAFTGTVRGMVVRIH